MNEYKLPLETLPSLELASHLDDINEFKEFLTIRNIKVQNTRIDRYIKFLNLILEDDSSKNSLVEIHKVFNLRDNEKLNSILDYSLYILREIHELMWILQGLKVMIPIGVEEKLKIIISGRDFASLDTNTNSRNTQFELRIASYFCQFGCVVDMSTETDIIAHTKKQVYFIECKRISNKNKVSERLSEARKQLERRMPKKVYKKDIYGCIAIDVTKVAFSHNGLTFGKTNEHSRDIIQEKLKEIVSDLEIKMKENFEKSKGLCSFWFQIHIPALIEYPVMTTTRFSSFHYQKRFFLKLNQRRAFKVFCKIFEFSSNNKDERTLSSKNLINRKEYVFPAGTLISIDESLLLEYLNENEIKDREADEIIGSLEMESTLHQFFYIDFITVIQKITKDEKKELINELDMARMTLIVKMYVQRFPYQN